MLLPQARNLAIIGAFVAVCALATVGWMRNGNSAALAATPYVPGDQSAASFQTATVNALSQPVNANDGYYPSRMRPVYIRQEAAPEVQLTPRSAEPQQEYYTDPQGRRRGRTKTHSVEIVAGTAAAGAVIGALAGGGKGAAIGAASGAGAGFIYDRVTHNH